jgi:endonuclease YncB( thermonuclease family)
MRRLRRYPAGALLVGVALVVTVAASANGATRASLTKMETGVLASVTDGDTIRLRDGRRVRLVQIDAPEVGSGECYSRASATVLRGLLPAGSTVRLEADPRLDKVDRYGRLLRYVWRGSVHTNMALVRTGAAAPWFYGGVKGKYAPQFISAANAARSGRVGLWKACPGTVLDVTKAIATRQGKPAAPPPVVSPTPTPAPAPATQCADTIDNDGDGKIDYPADPGCSSTADTDETDPALPPSNCSASYPDFCIPPPPPDKDCGDFSQKNFTVRWDVPNPDPHRLDGNKDGRACES